MAAEAGASMSFDALSGCIAKAKAKTPSHDELIEALKAFDHSGSGTIRTSDLKCDRAHPVDHSAAHLNLPATPDGAVMSVQENIDGDDRREALI
eukprot:COSAG02_NODE_4014_length_5905_cov_3.990872_3_plen_94_part_00